MMKQTITTTTKKGKNRQSSKERVEPVGRGRVSSISLDKMFGRGKNTRQDWGRKQLVLHLDSHFWLYTKWLEPTLFIQGGF